MVGCTAAPILGQADLPSLLLFKQRLATISSTRLYTIKPFSSEETNTKPSFDRPNQDKDQPQRSVWLVNLLRPSDQPECVCPAMRISPPTVVHSAGLPHFFTFGLLTQVTSLSKRFLTILHSSCSGFSSRFCDSLINLQSCQIRKHRRFVLRPHISHRSIVQNTPARRARHHAELPSPALSWPVAATKNTSDKFKARQ